MKKFHRPAQAHYDVSRHKPQVILLQVSLPSEKCNVMKGEPRQLGAPCPEKPDKLYLSSVLLSWCHIVEPRLLVENPSIQSIPDKDQPFFAPAKSACLECFASTPVHQCVGALCSVLDLMLPYDFGSQSGHATTLPQKSEGDEQATGYNLP